MDPALWTAPVQQRAAIEALQALRGIALVPAVMIEANADRREPRG
jgi:hypothetical protein